MKTKLFSLMLACMFIFNSFAFANNSIKPKKMCQRLCHEEFKSCKRHNHKNKHKKTCKVEYRRCLQNCPR